MLLLNTLKINETEFTVEWAAGRTRAGVMTISFPSEHEDQKVVAEVFALSQLLERFPGCASQVVTSQGALRKLLKNSGGRPGARELGALKIKYPNLAFASCKKNASKIAEIFSSVGTEAVDRVRLSWHSLGRPRIATGIGFVEVTEHAMARYRERIAATGTLNRLEKLLARDLIPVRQCKAKLSLINERYKARRHTIFRLAESDIHVVIAQHPTGVRRLTTCYRQF